jgi:hypothetical protein
MKIGVSLLIGVMMMTGALRLSADGPGPQTDFSRKWQGVWKGTLKVSPLAGESQEVPMELHIQPIKDRSALQWQIVYGEGEKRLERDYELVPQEGKPGQFVIDEKNTVLIDARQVADVLYSQFQVGEYLISSRYERRRDRLFVEMTSYSLHEPRKTGGAEKDPKSGVLSYLLQSVQTAELRR